MQKSEWTWMPHAGHLIVSNDCRFRLNTCVGEFIVSTVGEYFPDAGVREILAESRGVKLVGRGDERRADYMRKIGFEDIGCDRKYETMVFFSEPSGEGCCPHTPRNYRELDCRGYNSAADATKGHLELCEEWSSKTAGDVPQEESYGDEI